MPKCQLSCWAKVQIRQAFVVADDCLVLLAEIVRRRSEGSRRLFSDGVTE